MAHSRMTLCLTVFGLALLSEKGYVFGCSGGGTEETENPTFKRRSCADVEEEGYVHDICIEVRYPDKYEDVVMLLRVKGENTVYDGYMFNEKSKVSAIFSDPKDESADVEVIYLWIYIVANYFRSGIILFLSLFIFITETHISSDCHK